MSLAIGVKSLAATTGLPSATIAVVGPPEWMLARQLR